MKDVLLILLAVGLAYAAWTGYSENQARQEWEARADSALAEARAGAARARRAEAVADSVTEEAEALEEAADSLGRRTRERVVEVREVEVPEYAIPHVAPRDSIIDDLVREVGMLQEVIQTERTAKSALRVALSQVTKELHSLEAVLETRPEPPAWWKPDIGFGAFAGRCDDGRMCSGVGLTLSWEVDMP